MRIKILRRKKYAINKFNNLMIPKRKGLSRLSIFYKKINHKIENKFCSKSICYKAIFSNVSFYNVNFKGAILTSCSFKDATFNNVEFLGTNLKKSNLKNATFKNCIFSAALLTGANFKGSKFENCIFANINFTTAKDLQINDGNEIISVHSIPTIEADFLELLNSFKFNQYLQNTRVLHLKNGKLNSLTLHILISQLGIEKCKKGLKNLNVFLSSNVITAYQLCDLIDKASSD